MPNGIKVKGGCTMVKFSNDCPRCGGKDFEELDCGPDSWDDDIVWSAFICKECKLYYSDWTEKWYVDCSCWLEEDCSIVYKERG